MGIRLGRAEYFVVPGDKADFGIGSRTGAAKRADINMDAIRAGKRGQAQIGNDKPLRRLQAVIAVGVAVVVRLRALLGRACRDHIQAGFQVRQKRIDRECRRDLFVEL